MVADLRRESVQQQMPGTCLERDDSKLQFMFKCPGSSLTKPCYGLYKRDVYLRSADLSGHVPAAFLSFFCLHIFTRLICPPAHK